MKDSLIKNPICFFLKENGPCLLFLIAIFSFISKSFYNYPIIIMSFLGLYILFRKPDLITKDRYFKTFSLIFLCAWLPLLFSFPDAVRPGNSARTLFSYLRFYFCGIFIIYTFSRDKNQIKAALSGIICILFFWCFDATIQFIFGKDLFGFPYQLGHITGMFYPRNTISHVCAVLSPFCFLYAFSSAHLKKRVWIIVMTIILLIFIVFLSGRRAALIMLILSMLGSVFYGCFYSLNKISFIKITSLTLSIAIILITSTIFLHEPTKNRYLQTKGLFSSDYEKINLATSNRLPIWETTYSIFKSNLINGIGPRGFRDVYRNYAKEGDYFVLVNKIPTQPHLISLEILAETGLIGFIGYLLMFFFLFAIFKEKGSKLFFFLLAILIAIFPFNSHMAFYGSIWSSMIWLLISLFIARARLHPS